MITVYISLPFPPVLLFLLPPLLHLATLADPTILSSILTHCTCTSSTLNILIEFASLPQLAHFLCATSLVRLYHLAYPRRGTPGLHLSSASTSHSHCVQHYVSPKFIHVNCNTNNIIFCTIIFGSHICYIVKQLHQCMPINYTY